MTRFLFLASFIAVTLCLSDHVLSAGDATYFRHDNGVATDSAPLPTDFGSKSNRIWRVSLKSGISSPCVHGDRIFITTFDKDSSELATAALDANTGATLWTKAVPTKRIEDIHQVGSPASCTPACDGERVYSFFGSYGLLCYDLNGKLLWERQLGPFQDEFGASSSPIVVDDLVILNEDHDVDCFLMAFDKLTGRTHWKIPRDGFTRSYSSPILVETADDRSLVVAGSLKLVAYEIATGKPKWWVNGLSRIVDPTPVYAEGLVYIATWTPGGDPSSRISMGPYSDALTTWDANRDGLIAKSELSEGAVLQRFFRIDLDQDEKLSKSEWEKHGRVFELAHNAATAVRPGGKGDVTDSNVAWTYQRGLPTVPSSVVYRGVMYMVKDSGIITALDAHTGELLKQGRARGPGNYYASLVAGDGHVYLVSERGVITVLKADRDWSVVSSHDFGERVLATPAIRNGRIYLRTDEAMYCFAKP